MGLPENLNAAMMNIRHIEEYLEDAKKGGYVDKKNVPLLHLAHIRAQKVLQEAEKLTKCMEKLEKRGEIQ